MCLWQTGFSARRLDAVDLAPLEDPAAVGRCRLEVRQVRVEEGIGRYVVAIVRKTRQAPNIA